MEAYGYASTVAVNSELSFTRPVRLGEKLYYTTRLDSVGDEKTTALGTGFFVTLVMSHFVEKAGGDEPVGELLFRVFKFRAANAQAPAKVESHRSSPSVRCRASATTRGSSGKAARKASC